MYTHHWPLVTGHWSLVTGHWPLVTGHWSLLTGSDQLVQVTTRASVMVLGRCSGTYALTDVDMTDS